MNRLSMIAAGCAGVGLLCIALLGVADIIGTQFLGRPVPGTLEITKTLLVFCILLGVAQAEADGKHIRVQVAVNAMPTRLSRVLDLLAPLSMAVFFGAIAWAGWDMLRQSVTSGEYDEGLIKLPLWPARLALAVGATLMTAQCLVNMVRRLRGSRVPQRDEPLAPL